jgi:ABC-type nickel/cobalt efflux system permease component RcnA
MTTSPGASLLVVAVAAVGVLHTMVPDHWAPIALLARQRGWSVAEASRAAAGAGVGHVLSTLAIAVLVWAGGAVLAARFGHLVSLLASVALVLFGAWIAIGAWRELRRGDGHPHFGHRHVHAHADGRDHVHWHEHEAEDVHDDVAAAGADAVHEHAHETSSRTALLLVLGSSPMIEGIPAFFAASRYGVGQLALMAAVFGCATIATYVVLVASSVAGLKRLNLGPLERYGEVLSGAFIAALGVVFYFLPW